MYEPDFNTLYLLYLNGGSLTDWEDIKKWAENLLKVKEVE